MITNIVLSKQDNLALNETYGVDIGLQSIPPDAQGHSPGPFTVRLAQTTGAITKSTQKNFPTTQTSAHFDLQSIFDSTHGGSLNIRVQQTFLGFARFDGYDIPMNLGFSIQVPTYDYIAIAVSGADPQPEGNNSWVVTGQLQDVANNNSFAAIPGISLDLIQDGIRINTSVTDAGGHVSSQIVNLPPGTHSLQWHDPAKNLDSGIITVTVTPADGGGGGGGGGGTVPPVDFFGILHAFKMAAIFGGLILAGVIDYRGRRKRR
jgi:hypothetical protein